MEMFQRSFSADDDMDEAILLEAANDWEDTPPETTSAQHHGTSTDKQWSYKDRWLTNFIAIIFWVCPWSKA